MNAIYILLQEIIRIYGWLLIASVILSWLVTFNVVNPHNRIVHTIGEFLYRITEPALRPIRRYVPSVAGLDLSPIILYFALQFVSLLLAEYWPR